MLLMEHGSHRAIEHQDTFVQNLFEGGHKGGVCLILTGIASLTAEAQAARYPERKCAIWLSGRCCVAAFTPKPCWFCHFSITPNPLTWIGSARVFLRRFTIHSPRRAYSH